MLEIPLQSAPSQLTKIVLDEQNFQIYIYQKDQGLFVDVNVNGTDIVSGIIALDAVPIICREYENVSGNLLFVDTQGNSDPEYTGLGTRYALVYLTAAENDLIQQ